MGLGLNLGSGQHPARRPEWVDVDLRWDGVVTPTVYGDLFTLPFRNDAFDRAFLSHLWEHIWWHEIANGAFDEIWRVMKPGAEVVVVGPCMRKAVELGEPRSILMAILGEGGATADDIQGPGAHRWVATEALTAHAMTLAGLVNVEPVDVRLLTMPMWPNAAPNALWQAALRARVPG